MIGVLFVCIGNSCRSQMAEGFARKYGSDIIQASSAGVAPAPIVQPLTIQVMFDKNIDIGDQYPKSLLDLCLNSFELVINMSGVPLPVPVSSPVRLWKVVDPMLQSKEIYIKVRDQIEGLVMRLVMEFRRTGLPLQPRLPADPFRAPSSPRPAPPAAPRSVSPAAPAPAAPEHITPSSQRYGFGRVRKARD